MVLLLIGHGLLSLFCLCLTIPDLLIARFSLFRCADVTLHSPLTALVFVLVGASLPVQAQGPTYYVFLPALSLPSSWTPGCGGWMLGPGWSVTCQQGSELAQLTLLNPPHIESTIRSRVYSISPGALVHYTIDAKVNPEPDFSMLYVYAALQPSGQIVSSTYFWIPTDWSTVQGYLIGTPGTTGFTIEARGYFIGPSSQVVGYIRDLQATY